MSIVQVHVLDHLVLTEVNSSVPCWVGNATAFPLTKYCIQVICNATWDYISVFLKLQVDNWAAGDTYCKNNGATLLNLETQSETSLIDGYITGASGTKKKSLFIYLYVRTFVDKYCLIGSNLNKETRNEYGILCKEYREKSIANILSSSITQVLNLVWSICLLLCHIFLNVNLLSSCKYQNKLTVSDLLRKEEPSIEPCVNNLESLQLSYLCSL